MPIHIKTSTGLEPLIISLIQEKIEKFAKDLDVDTDLVIQKVVAGLVDNMTTTEIDEYTASICEQLMINHYDYTILGGRILIDRHNKKASFTFFESLVEIRNYNVNLISDELFEVASDNKKYLNNLIQTEKDFEDMSIFRAKNEIKKYLIHTKKDGVKYSPETLQYRRLRNALGIWGKDILNVTKTYKRLANNDYTHSGCINRNAGKVNAQLANCILMSSQDSFFDKGGIYDTVVDSAKYASNFAGIGVCLTQVRAKGSDVNGQIGVADGIGLAMSHLEDIKLRIKRGNREAAIAVYLETWHADIFDFIIAKRPKTEESKKFRHLDYGLMLNGLFMDRVISDDHWSLFNPKDTPDLVELHGDEFNTAYIEYEKQGKAMRVVKARDLYNEILTTIQETGEPYIVSKDSVNLKNNLKHYGSIIQSNLCSEIVLPTSNGEITTCNLANIVLPSCIMYNSPQGGHIFNLEKARQLAYELTLNVDKVIDITYYPTERGRITNLELRPIAIGIQGLADTFAILGLDYDSKEARKLNKDIAEAIYFGCLEASCDLAKKHGAYKYFEGSPASKGILQFDMWKNKEVAFQAGEWKVAKESEVELSDRQWFWGSLREDIMKYGLRNSLLTGYMPTVGSGQILGNTASFEPFQPLITKNQTLAGKFYQVNKHLIKVLSELGLMSEQMGDKIVSHKGSIQNIDEIPDWVKSRFKTAFEISMKTQLEMAHDRSPFIDHTQSLNWFLKRENFEEIKDEAEKAKKLDTYLQGIMTRHIICHLLELKTWNYYIHSEVNIDSTVGNIVLLEDDKPKLYCAGGGCE